MKKVLLVLTMVALTFSMNAQVTISYEELSSSTKRPRGIITEYVTSLGDTLKIGDKIAFANPSNGNNSFVYIWEMSAMSNPVLASIRAQGFESQIIKMRVLGTKRRGYTISIVGKTAMGLSRYYIQYEKALSVNEVKTDKLNREQAISKLKEAKELFELDMISKEEYDAIKLELTPIIKSK